MTATQATLQRNFRNWINDRAENDEPLLLGEFKAFMKNIGYSNKELSDLLTKQRRLRAKKQHSLLKKKLFSDDFV